MTAVRLHPVLPVDDLEEAVAFWTAALGVEPTFVDGDRWAQFDVGASRVALAGRDRTADVAGVLVKVEDLDATRAELVARGLEVTAIEAGPHERRCTATAPGGWVTTFYAAA
ncbi:VOC family protein [Patulibacter sp. S7RM1-6]